MKHIKREKPEIGADENTSENVISRIYHRLLEHFGYRDWWPGDTRDEIIIGAILTQNTSWSNVERAIGNLKNENVLSLEGILKIPIEALEEFIRPSGYFRQKAERLRTVARELMKYPGGTNAFFDQGREMTDVRTSLLSIKGIGPETADSILLYAASFPAFVIDSYTFRIFERLGLYTGKKNYHKLQKLITDYIDEDIEIYGDYHAQIVELGKNYCRKLKPICTSCPLLAVCPKVGVR